MITLYCVHPKGFNVGNDAIHVGLRELVHEAFGRVVNIISIPAVSHYESQSKSGLTAKTIHEMNRFADGVIVGGGNLYENGELTVNADALASLEPPLMLFSLSRGRVYNRNLQLVERTDVMPDRAIQALHQRADYSLARDPATFDYLKGIGCNQAVMATCPTLGLERAASRLPPLPEAEVPGVLISVRNPALMNIPLRLQARVQNDIEQTIDFLRAQGVGRIRLLCHDVRDVEFATIFQSSRNVDYVYTNDVYWYLALLRQARLVVSYRLHATLPCFAFGVPSIKISYDERALSLFDAVGLGDWNINMVESGDVVADIKDRYARLGELAALQARIKPLWAAHWQTQLDQMTAFAGDVQRYARTAHAALQGVPRGD